MWFSILLLIVLKTEFQQTVNFNNIAKHLRHAYLHYYAYLNQTQNNFQMF